MPNFEHNLKIQQYSNYAYLITYFCSEGNSAELCRKKLYHYAVHRTCQGVLLLENYQLQGNIISLLLIIFLYSYVLYLTSWADLVLRDMCNTEKLSAASLHLLVLIVNILDSYAYARIVWNIT